MGGSLVVMEGFKDEEELAKMINTANRKFPSLVVGKEKTVGMGLPNGNFENESLFSLVLELRQAKQGRGQVPLSRQHPRQERVRQGPDQEGRRQGQVRRLQRGLWHRGQGEVRQEGPQGAVQAQAGMRVWG